MSRGYKIPVHVPAPDPEVAERIAAADLVMRSRQVTKLRPTLTVESRAELALAFERVALELNNAADYLRRPEADAAYIPPFLRTDGPPIRLIPERDARFHD